MAAELGLACSRGIAEITHPRSLPRVPDPAARTCLRREVCHHFQSPIEATKSPIGAAFGARAPASYSAEKGE
eukprot:scaffold2144_cov334-Prasinococcus_capsulatus_cf.AAC.15